MNGTTLTDRTEFGPDIHLQIPFHNFGFSHIAGDHSRMAIRMGGAKSGKEIAERLLAAGLEPDQVISQVFQSLETLKVGVVSLSGNRITIEENIEPMRTWYMTLLRELSCHFTTGFLNGLYKSTYDLRIKETKCLAAGHPHCECITGCRRSDRGRQSVGGRLLGGRHTDVRGRHSGLGPRGR